MLALAALGVAATLCCRHQAAEALTIRQDFWALNGGVYAAVLSGNTLYLGGGFQQVGPVTGGGVPIAAGSGAPLAGFPKVTGYVYAIAPDGSGGWFIGGGFTAVGGLPRLNLAHVLPDYSVSDWAADANFPILSLVRDGGTLYVAGLFTMIRGQSRSCIAALKRMR